MGVRSGDLVDTVLSKISIDEFEPKTGDGADIVVIGFYVIEQYAVQDLYSFISSSAMEVRDIEVSPNPDLDGNYMLFVEMDRNADLMQRLYDMVSDVENVAGALKWRATTHLTDEYYPLHSNELLKYVITDPERYVTRKEFDQQDEPSVQESASKSQIMEFLKVSDLTDASINQDNELTVTGRNGTACLKIIDFGDAERTLLAVGIDKSPILDTDYHTRLFNQMLGDLSAVKILDYIVIFNSDTKQVLVCKPC